MTAPECLVIYARHGTEGNGAEPNSGENFRQSQPLAQPASRAGVEFPGPESRGNRSESEEGFGVNRTFMFLSAVLGFAAMVYLTSTSNAQPGAPPAPAPTTRPTIAVFNMAAVMRDFGQAKYQVYVLNKKRTDESKRLLEWRGEYLGIQKDLTANPNDVQKDAKTKRLVDLSRMIEDEDRRINKLLNDDASAIIADLYDKIKMVVDKTAEMNGYHIVFAYPDAVTAEEMKSPYIKELKLKPPAAQPFYVAPHVDITGVVVKTLNAWYAAPPVPETPAPAPGPTPGPAPGPTPGPVPGPVPGGMIPRP